MSSQLSCGLNAIIRTGLAFKDKFIHAIMSIIHDLNAWYFYVSLCRENVVEHCASKMSFQWTDTYANATDNGQGKFLESAF